MEFSGIPLPPLLAFTLKKGVIEVVRVRFSLVQLDVMLLSTPAHPRKAGTIHQWESPVIVSGFPVVFGGDNHWSLFLPSASPAYGFAVMDLSKSSWCLHTLSDPMPLEATNTSVSSVEISRLYWCLSMSVLSLTHLETPNCIVKVACTGSLRFPVLCDCSRHLWTQSRVQSEHLHRKSPQSHKNKSVLLFRAAGYWSSV